MCGIQGFVFRSPKKITGMESLLSHRGPDDQGALFWNGEEEDPYLTSYRTPSAPFRVALFHTRLSILDLSKAGWQPMASADRRYFIVYNGEVYNYREIRYQLEKMGYTFRSHTDTEVVLNAYAAWGIEALQKFEGMFALAILDTKCRKLLLARDFFGIKPLYYALLPQQSLVFASEIKALVPFLPGVQSNPRRVYDYLRYGVTDQGEETLFEGIYQVPAAHYMYVPLDRPTEARPQRYWDLRLEEPIQLSFNEAAQQLRELFLESIALHLRSDVPVGTALSGGIDSSSIVAAIRYLYPSAEIHTFSFIPYGDKSLSEERWIDLAAEHVKARVHKVYPHPDELLQDVDDLIYAQDEPFGSTSIYAQYRVFRLARETGVKVMLDGQGADELLAGYPTFYASRLLSLLRQRRYAEAWAFFRWASRVPASQGALSMLKRVVAQVFPEPFLSWARHWAGEQAMPYWMNSIWFKERGVEACPLWKSQASQALREHLLRTLQDTNLPALLRYEDRNSMWHSIESRVPFLTPKMAQFLLSLPEEYLISSQGVTKAVFRQAMRGIVPDVILERRDKIGFRTPESFWLTALRPWVERVLKGEVAREIPAVRWERAYAEWEAMLQRRRPYKGYVWRWVNLIRWTERFGVVYD